jgi:hypothetical protein
MIGISCCLDLIFKAMVQAIPPVAREIYVENSKMRMID